MKRSLIPAALLVVIVGCARFTTKQTDISYEQGVTNGPSRAITTKVSATTFFSGKSELAKFKANQTDKTQSAAVGSLQQSTDATTNVNNIVSAVIGAAIKAAAGQ